MEENVSGCFFLNTVYMFCDWFILFDNLGPTERRRGLLVRPKLDADRPNDGPPLPGSL